MPDFTYDVGRVSFVMKGAWNLATAYEKLDAVSYGGSLYIAKQDVPGGTAITNTTYWQLAAEKGDQGETGNGIASITKTGTAGNVDTYTITFTDGTTTTFTVTNGGVTTVNGRTGDVTGLAEEDGSYPLLNAGTADNLTPYSEDSGATQDIPFIAQGTGCGNGESVVDTGSYLQFKKKLGNTVCVNQLVPDAHSIAAGTYNWNGIFGTSISGKELIKDHYYLTFVDTPELVIRWRNESLGVIGTNGRYVVYKPTTTDNHYYVQASGTLTSTAHLKWSDLTLWFGSTADIPSELLSHPENWGRYYAGSLAYNAGTLDSADGTVMRSIGRNVWDEEWEQNGYSTETGEKMLVNYRIRSTNKIPVIPNTSYYMLRPATASVYFYDKTGAYLGYTSVPLSNVFTTPHHCTQITFQTGSSSQPQTTYGNNITISLYYPGESGYDQYYPYTVLAEVDTGSEVLRSAGAVADEKTPDGTITRRCYEVTYDGSNDENWTAETIVSIATTDKNFYISAPLSKKAVTVRTNRFVSYAVGNAYLVAGQPNAFVSGGGNLNVYFNQGLTDVTALRTYLSSNPLTVIYELATPTTEQGTAFAENIPCDDFGSMYWTQTKGIPQGNEIFYPVDYKASIDTLYNRVGGDMSKIVTDDEYPEAPSSDGTYVLKATVSGGTKTYAWVAE